MESGPLFLFYKNWQNHACHFFFWFELEPRKKYRFSYQLIFFIQDGMVLGNKYLPSLRISIEKNSLFYFLNITSFFQFYMIFFNLYFLKENLNDTFCEIEPNDTFVKQKYILTFHTKITHILYKNYWLFTQKAKWHTCSFFYNKTKTYKWLTKKATTNKN